MLDTGYVLATSNFTPATLSEHVLSSRRSVAIHPWHDLESGPEAPNSFNCIIEVTKGSNLKYKLDKASGLIKIDHVHLTSVAYSQNYGFIPRTICEDKDPMEALILKQDPMMPGCLLQARAIGLMPMIDQGQNAPKVISVCAHDPAYMHYKDITDLHPHRLAEIRTFFENYKKDENNEVIVKDFLPVKDAIKAIKDSMQISSYQSLRSLTYSLSDLSGDIKASFHFMRCKYCRELYASYIIHGRDLEEVGSNFPAGEWMQALFC